MPIFQPGEIVLRDYQIEAFIGEGGFGEVYRALDLNLNMPVALKILRRSADMDPTYYERARQRFTLEALLGHRITHPNVVRVYKFAPDEASGLLVLVMEFVSGGSLADRLKAGPLTISSALQIARQVAAGLGAMHALDVVHRDLKPSNILLDHNGTARVADLGLAQPASSIQVTRSSSGGGGVWQSSPGTPAYMSPEQEAGRPHLPPASDVYALGLILFEMLTGHLYKHQPPGTRVASLRPEVPAAVDGLLTKMLAGDPQQRLWNGTAAEKALANLVTPNHKTTKILLIAGGATLLGGMVLMIALGLWLILAKNPPLINLPQKDSPIDLSDTPSSLIIPTNKPTLINQPSLAPSDEPAATPTNIPTATTDPRLLPDCTAIGQQWTSPRDGMTLVCVPAGNFLMGSAYDGNAESDEIPQHSVYLDAYWVDQTEVTNQQYRQCVAAGACRAPGFNASYSHTSYYGNSEFANYPVINVAWKDATDYCSWVDRALPTEAEWEKAARGTEGQLYPWGNGDLAGYLLNFADIHSPHLEADHTIDDGKKDTAPVGSYPSGASPYGAWDMAGNVWEWTADWYSEYYYSSQTTWRNPPGPTSGGYRVLRGGSFGDAAVDMRTAGRLKASPELLTIYIGFRCVTAPTP